MNQNKSDLPMKENSKEIVRPSREKPCRSEQTDCSEPPPEVASPVDSASASVATTAASVMAQRPSLNEGSITTAGKWTSPVSEHNIEYLFCILVLIEANMMLK